MRAGVRLLLLLLAAVAAGQQGDETLVPLQLEDLPLEQKLPLAEEEDSLIADAEVSSTGIPVLVRSNNETLEESPLRLEFNISTAEPPLVGEERLIADQVARAKAKAEADQAFKDEEKEIIAKLGKPHNLTASNVTATSMQLSWKMNTSFNNIRGYRVFYKHDSYADIKTFNGQLPRFSLSGLVPYTQYNVWVRPISTSHPNVIAEESETILQTTDTAEPSAPFITNVTCYETQKIYIEWKRPTLYYKTINYYFVYYRAEGEREFKSHQMQADSKDDQRFFLEQENSSLTPRKNYCIKISAGTRSTSSDIVYQGEHSEEQCVYLPAHGCGVEVTPPPSLPATSQLSAGVIIGAVAALLVLLIAVLGLVVWRRYCDSAYYYLEDPPRIAPPVGIPDWEEEPGPDGGRGAVAVDDFPAHVSRLHADSDIGFSREYDEILRYSMKSVNATHEHSSHPDNKHKNRYLNIVAYDHSRVALTSLPGQRNSDYINANYIDGFQQFQAYIGSQGPLDETFETFWRMIWEQKVYVIVMITNLVERGRRKCDMYWPKEGSMTYGHIDVTLVKEDVMANYTVRRLRVKHTKVKKKKWSVGERMVEQYHYTGWPDHGTPGDTLPVLSFVRKSVACNPPDGGPIVAHCSAGVGRTGTYIAIDAMLKQAKAKGELNVFGFLKHIRSQRNHLVQTEEQYVFLHDALVEALSCGVTEVKLNEVGDHVARLQAAVSEVDTRQLVEKQFDLVCSFAPSDYDQAAARRPCNLEKNRDPHLVPIEAARVALTAKPGVDGSDYINASWVQGYHKVKEFVITQHPTAETRDAFWTMLWDHNAQTVVLLTPLTQTTAVFWPVKHEEYDLDYFKVRFIESTVHEGHTTLDFVISSRYDDYELKVRIVHCQGWPHSAGALHKVFNAVSIVQAWHLEYQNGPLVLVDRNGGTEAATFAALTTLKKQIDREQAVDVYQVCKLLHNKRPGVWRGQEDYLYIHKFIAMPHGQAVEALGQQPLPDENTDAVMGAHSNGVGALERRHSSTEGGSFRGEPVVKITVNRRHSLPSEGSTRGGSLSNGAVTIELVSSGSGESAGRDSSPESTEISMPETCGSTAVLVSVTDDLVQVEEPSSACPQLV